MQSSFKRERDLRECGPSGRVLLIFKHMLRVSIKGELRNSESAKKSRVKKSVFTLGEYLQNGQAPKEPDLPAMENYRCLLLKGTYGLMSGKGQAKRAWSRVRSKTLLHEMDQIHHD